MYPQKENGKGHPKVKHRKIALLLIAVMLFGLVAGCGAQSKLVGTWEAETQASVLGFDISTGSVSFSFEKDGTGTMSGELGSTGLSSNSDFTYTVEKDQLTLTFESGNTEVFTFVVEKDVLKLDGSTDFELTKAS